MEPATENPYDDMLETIEEATENVSTAVKDLFRATGQVLNETIPGAKEELASEEPDSSKICQSIKQMLGGMVAKGAPEEEQQEIIENIENAFDFSNMDNFTEGMTNLLGKLLGGQDSQKVRLMKILAQFQIKTAVDTFSVASSIVSSISSYGFSVAGSITGHS